MTSRNWVKVHCDKWLSGTIRDEPPEIRAVFVDLLALAGGGQYGDVGEIKLANGIGYTDQQISEILRIKLVLWRRAKRQLITSNRIETTSKGAITIVNWSKYQSDYQRQRPYRQKQAGDALSPEPPPYPLPIENQNEKEKENENKKESYTEKLQPEVTTKGYTTHEPSTSEERNPTTRVTGLEDGDGTKHHPEAGNVASRRKASAPVKRVSEAVQRTVDYTDGAEPAIGELASEAGAGINEVADVLWYLEEPANIADIAEAQTFGDSAMAARILKVLKKHGWVRQDGDIWQCVNTIKGAA